MTFISPGTYAKINGSKALPPPKVFQNNPSNFNPLDLNTLSWHDASDVTTVVESGGLVSRWNDKAGNLDLEQLTGSKQPLFGRTYNGLNVLEGDGTKAISVFNYSYPSPVEFMIAIFAGVDAVTSQFDGFVGFNAAPPDWKMTAANNTQFDGKIQLNPDLFFTGGPYPGPSVYVVVWNWSSQQYEVFIDGTSVGSQAYTTQLDSPVQYTLLATKGESDPIDGFVGESIVVEEVDQSSRQKLEGFIAHKWGVNSNLPINHPFRYRSPI